MQHKLKFIPKILLCGDESELLAHIDNRPFRIIGYAKISGEINGQSFNFVQDNKIFFNDELQELPALIKFLQSGAVDYFIFTNREEFVAFRNNSYNRGFFSAQVLTPEEFKALPSEFFYDATIDFFLLPHLKNSSIRTLLDVDGYFSKGRIFTKLSNDFTEIDCISDKPLLPITENIYTHVYKNFSEVGLKRYDAVLILERSPIEFESLLILLENFSDKIITFARSGSELEKHIFGKANNFAEVYGLRGGANNCYFLTRRTPPEDFCNYVVTHKETKLDPLPEGYKIIHAGKSLGNDLGYIGDDTGNNISRLNLYINEITALYWIWKNTNHTTIGLCHYRRFFTESNDPNFSYDKILTQDAAQKILENYDIIVSEIYYGGLTQHEFIVNDCGDDLANLGEAILKRQFLQVQPDYLDAFEFVMNSTTLYKCNMFVTRRNILEAYCKWLFSFYLDATEEALQKAQLQNLSWSPRRLMSFLAERMLTVWLIKNRLRIKELKIMQVDGL